MTGKLADTVMSVRNGEQLARKYQPKVYNPSTSAQVAQRAKLKLLSQLSAVLAPVIAIRKVGPVSARNLFTKINFPFTTFNDEQADITLTNVQLTSSTVGIPAVVANRAAGQPSNLEVSLASLTTNIDRVVYITVVKNADQSLRVLSTKVVNTPGADFNFPTSLAAASPEEVVVYAYGVRDNTDAARTVFGNLTAVTAESVAKVITTSVLTETDVTLSRTVATVVAQGNRDVDPEEKTSRKK